MRWVIPILVREHSFCGRLWQIMECFRQPAISHQKLARCQPLMDWVMYRQNDLLDELCCVSIGLILFEILPLSHKILANSMDRLFNKILAISSTIPTFVQNYSFSKYIAKMLAPKSQYSLLIAKMFAPKSQYSHRELASFGDYRRAIF